MSPKTIGNFSFPAMSVSIRIYYRLERKLRNLKSW